ncbi:FKBP-type peptidyl-prolyl cis-trans isomerase [Colwellia psychrerythraea]|uniref:Peptidyl-prolyl cis-trans isomerase n=1 Tax=Colwellia psychrerythraea TaxID=28229 RepID=A0A099KB13_COLPS|nr:FKBP-type peptidyl-prolyl cis-trans isomerase [Colwellia psychrerythraea]KGJ87242.1 peptidylprolyl isomerase FKBP-type [Colwellia psychrerythraea]
MTVSTQAQIQSDSSILVHITMKLSDGSAADSTKVNNKPAKIIMGDNSISPAFEAQLIGMNKGDSKEFTLEAKDAFGESNPDNIHYMGIDKFTAEVPAKVGNIITFSQPGGDLPGMIKEINGDSVTIDFNHPLAGQTVTFVIDLVDIL